MALEYSLSNKEGNKSVSIALTSPTTYYWTTKSPQLECTTTTDSRFM